MITYGSTTLTSYNSIVRTEVYYYKSTSATSLSGGSWSTTKPTWENGKYIWQKIRTVYEDGTHSESDPVNITGQQGATGTAAYSYKLNSSDSIIGKTKDGEYTIKKITFSATCKQGTGAVSAYNGRFKIESTTNGSTWKTEYASSENEASKEFTIPDDIILIKCSLYQSDGTTVLLDIVTVPVVKDGVDAIGLRDSIPYYLASDKDTGITRLTQGWTRYRPQLTAEKKYLWVYYVSRYSEGATEPELIEIKDDLVHFENNGDESPVESCVVDIDPVQDLHGYDSPWPAGGGKNLIIDAENIVIDKLGSAEGSRNEYSYINVGQSYMDVPDGTNVTISFDIEMVVNTANPRLQVYNTNNKGPKQIMGVTKTFTAAVGTTIKERCSLTTTIADRSDTTQTNNAIEFYTNYGSSNFYRITNIMLEIGTTASAFEPYSNICPITGWTGVEVQRTGKNLADEAAIFGTLQGWTSSDGVYTGELRFIQFTYGSDKGIPGLKFKPSTQYTVSVHYSGATSANGLVLVFLYTDGTRSLKICTAETPADFQLVSSAGKTIKKLALSYGSNMVASISNFQLVEGSTATDYEPYQGNTYPITFPSEAGTVYGGTLDVTNGVLTVDRAMITKNTADMNNISADFPGWRNSGIEDIIGRGINDKMNHLIMNIGTVCVANTTLVDGGIMALPKSSYGKTQDEWKALAIDVQAVLPLATPIIYQLTPTEITMLCKENNIFADTGQTAISYYDNQTSTDPYVDYSLTSAFDASTIEPAYIETEWVESTGKQYVYLDWKPPIKTWGFEIDFISYNALGTSAGAWNEDTNKNGYGTIFGVRNASGVNNAQLSSYSNGLLRIGNGANQATGFKTNHTRQQIKLQNTTITKTDGTTSTVSRLDETANKPYCNMTVFGLHEGLRRAGNGGINEPSSTRIYSLKFYDGDTLTVDLVGAIRKRDSVTGLYDKVSKHFYPAPGMLFGDVIGDIGDSISMKEAMDKANPQTIVVNKDRTRMWEATVPFNDLQDGQKITVTYSYGNIVSSVETDELIGWDDTSNNQQVYLKLIFADGHKTDWIPCYYSNTGRLTTHYGAGIPIQLTYRENILSNATETAGGSAVVRGFFANPVYDSNYYDRRLHNNSIKAKEAVTAYHLICGDEEGYQNIDASVSFDLGYPILYASGGIAATKTATNTYEAMPGVDFTYTGTIQNGEANKMLWLKGTVNGNTFTVAFGDFLTTVTPTMEDGMYYIPLGIMASATSGYFSSSNRLYAYIDDAFQPVDTAAVIRAQDAKNSATAVYGTCSTDAGTAAKAVTCSNFVLFNGARIQVTFTNANTASAPTLNVNSTGAKAIYINKTVTSSSNLLLWTAGSKMEFVYDGTGWIAQNVPYALYGTCSTGASTAAKIVTCNEAVICKGTSISINMTNTNTTANATLNVGSTVAKDIYANDAKLTVNSRFNWRANTVQKFVFDGQVWRMDDDSVKALATAYITEIDEDGIMVHPEDDSNSGWAISDAIQLFKNGISYIKLWIENNIPKIRIGKEDQGHIVLDNDSVDVRNGNDILASFGETSIIGDQNQWHQTIASDKTSFANGQTEYAYISPDKFYAVNAEVSDAFYIGNYSIRNAKDGKLIIGLRGR